MEPFAAVGPLIDPAANSLHILLVAANLKSRQAVEATLYSCNYQVTACKTSQEAIQVLKAQQGPEGSANFDLILKDHCPSSGTNTCRFLRRAQHEQLLQGIPVIVASAEEDRDLMVNCLQLGAADFMLKPLRASDLRNLWARVYWWRRATYHQPTVASTPALNNDSRSGSASDETREQTTEPQDAALDQGLCAEGSEPTIKSTLGRSNESGDQSKGNQGWSGDKTNGDSKPGTQQGSNNPSIPSQHTTDPACLMNVPSSLGGYHGNSVPRIPPDFTPLDLQTRQNQPHKPTANAAEPRAATTGANPGFRAYVATEQQNQGVKRSLPDLNSREDPGSSGSDWTNSLDKANQNKRQAVQSIPEANGYNMSNGISALTQAWVQGQQTQQNYQNPPNLNQQPANNRAAIDQVRADEKVNGSGNMPPPSNMPPGFPFCFVPGMMPPPFAMPQFWNQANGDNKNHQNMSMAMMFPSFGNTTPNGADGDNGNMQQQAQQAMHNQIMYHHNLLMQQYGMTPPFMQFSAFANAAHKQPSQELNHQLPIPVVAKRHKTHPGTIPNSSSQMILNSKSMTPNENLTSSNTRGPQRQNGMQPPSQANGESVNPSDTARNANGQMGVDGFLLEPSRKQRRAEALHKYKQKRKNLNFTKKIRYESRKQLAQARPRVKGQFVRITSEDVNAVVDSLTPAQMKGVADGTTDVTQLLMANAKTGDAAVKQEDLANRDPEISDEDESEPIEEDDVSSPASKDCAEKSHAFASIPLPSLPSPQQVAELIVQIEKKGRNSSHSGSNSPDAENEGTLPQIADGVQCVA